ncbi:hypothetical protein AGOR_G00077170 [Albula goreensis]|uniref:Uncharacterized protein n=1 Tax=Albula goreensis TaxID=1534307 RepID=A0A8T3DP91_9TELE|nr:hypothetical protein AGOR_G00077170 [Albula goreensis]
MEDGCSPATKRKDPNGYVNRVFNVSLDVDKEMGTLRIQDPEQGDAPVRCPSLEDGERVASSRRPRAAGIWKILTRKKAPIGCERRPHSMILPGEASIPRLSFVDKVRSFKKLRSSSIFKGRSVKMYGGKFSSALKDEAVAEFSARDYSVHTYTRKSPFRSKSKRHSYAGHTKDFDCTFEDMDLPSHSGNEHQLPRDLPGCQNGFKPGEGVPHDKRKAHPNFSNCNNSAASEEQFQRDSPKTVGRRFRGAEVWGYLKKISLMGKGASGVSEKSFDSEFHTLDKTIDSDCTSFDFECIQDADPPPTTAGAEGKGGHFRGLFRFFSSVAETARKWRSSGRSFSPPDGERSPMGSPGSQRAGLFPQDVPLYLGSENTSVCPSSPNLGSREDALPAGLIEEGSSLRVVLKSWKVTPDPPGSNGHLVDLLADLGTPQGSPCTPKASVELHVRHMAPASRTPSEGGTGSVCRRTEEAGDVGNDRDSEDVSVSIAAGPRWDQGKQRNAGGTETCSGTDSEPCSENALKDAAASRCVVRDGMADLGVVPVAVTSPTRRKRRPVSVYTPQLSLQCPVLEEGVVFSGRDGHDSPLWKRRAAPGAPGEPGMRRPLMRRRPHSVIDGSVPMESDPIHPLRPMTRPPGLSPRDPPFRATLQRCRSLPLSQSTPTGLEQTGWSRASTQPGDVALKLQSQAAYHTVTTRRRLLRPGSEQLHVNIVSHGY